MISPNTSRHSDIIHYGLENFLAAIRSERPIMVFYADHSDHSITRVHARFLDDTYQLHELILRESESIPAEEALTRIGGAVTEVRQKYINGRLETQQSERNTENVYLLFGLDPTPLNPFDNVAYSAWMEATSTIPLTQMRIYYSKIRNLLTVDAIRTFRPDESFPVLHLHHVKMFGPHRKAREIIDQVITGAQQVQSTEIVAEQFDYSSVARWHDAIQDLRGKDAG